MDISSDSSYEASAERSEEVADVVHLTHLTTPESIYHLQFGFADFASKPYVSTWYLWLMWPLTLWSVMLTWILNQTFVVERHRFNNLKLQTWSVPKYKIQYILQWQKTSINSLIEEAIVDANKKGIKVLSLGLLNQSEELNCNGGLYVKRHPTLKVKIVDGSNLAVAVIMNNIPTEATQVLFRGNLSKVAYAVVSALCHKGIRVTTVCKDEYVKLKTSLNNENSTPHLVYSKSYSDCQIWLVGDGLTREEQEKATKGTIIIPFCQFSPKKLRKDCLYHYTPALLTPKSLENVHACENWLPRRAMSAWRVAGIVHGLEGWNEHECGEIIKTNNYNAFKFLNVWEATLRHGFQPLPLPSKAKYY